MDRTNVFRNGGSLAVRLPNKYALPVGDVMIEARDGMVVLTPLDDMGWPVDSASWFSAEFGVLEIPARPKDSKSVEF